ncbi:uncharacterized protein LOC131874813 [Cryptomeria japonica]|uniref:uncharacterized protein LOC131874813 n=1 Tax=Cryptomeria japonica TaxID=3369 RepID=UPI0027DA47B3|nr:uncharacterized protein LOC131874813 [Cryptomeria japonica]
MVSRGFTFPKAVGSPSIPFVFGSTTLPSSSSPSSSTSFSAFSVSSASAVKPSTPFPLAFGTMTVSSGGASTPFSSVTLTSVPTPLFVASVAMAPTPLFGATGASVPKSLFGSTASAPTATTSSDASFTSFFGKGAFARAAAGGRMPHFGGTATFSSSTMATCAGAPASLFGGATATNVAAPTSVFGSAVSSSAAAPTTVIGASPITASSVLFGASATASSAPPSPIFGALTTSPLFGAPTTSSFASASSSFFDITSSSSLGFSFSWETAGKGNPRMKATSSNLFDTLSPLSLAKPATLALSFGILSQSSTLTVSFQHSGHNIFYTSHAF